MFALAEPSAMVLVAPVTPCGRIAQQIARCYLEAVCDCWRDGETERSRAFHQRLTRFRTAAMPLRPLRPSDAVSPHGGGGRGIAWYELPDALVGFIAGAPEGYVVPLSQVTDLVAAVDRTGTACACRVRSTQCPEPTRELAVKWPLEPSRSSLECEPPQTVKGGRVMNALIAVASKHGSTREIAQEIANELEQRGIDTDFADASAVTDLGHHDAVVLGSAVYMGGLMPEMRRFLDEHTTALLRLPVWLFGSGAIGDPPRPSKLPAELRAVADELGAQDCQWFAGRLDTAALGLKERLIVRAVKAAPGDYRPWDDIALWADEIAAALTAHAGSVPG